jgi:hypothetical protein
MTHQSPINWVYIFGCLIVGSVIGICVFAIFAISQMESPLDPVLQPIDATPKKLFMRSESKRDAVAVSESEHPVMHQ